MYVRASAGVALALLLSGPAAAGAQDTTKPKSAPAMKAGPMDSHMMGPWTEMNAFHQVMAAAWHPASEKNDLAPLRSRGKDLLTAAESWAGSKPPAMPASCASAPVRTAVEKVVAESRALVALLDAGADDAKLKAALRTVHDAFEIAEKGCGGHGSHGI